MLSTGRLGFGRLVGIVYAARMQTPDFAQLAALAKTQRLPAAMVDLGSFDRNVARVKELLAGKPIRLATKSLRCPTLIERALTSWGSQAIGLMTFHAEETLFWSRRGAHNLLLAYPTMQRTDADALVAANSDSSVATVVVDDSAQLEVLGAAARAQQRTLGVVIDLDVAWRPIDSLHLGARRSPLRTVEDVIALVDVVARTEGLRFAGLMAYEAHTAGLPDASPFSRALNRPKRAFRHVAQRDLERARERVVRALTAHGTAPKLVNGGGTGTLPSAASEACLSEVTAGSALLPGHLFDYYSNLSWAPSLVFALQAVRTPAPGFITCHGGGYVASGEAGPDRLPLPVFPPGLALLGPEGAGEVQTPLAVHHGVVRPGDIVLFRHAKAGELAEHFTEYLLVEDGRLAGTAKTYRGLGERFL